MSEEDVEEIRRQRIAQMQQQQAERARQQMMLQQLRKGAQLFLTREAQDRLDTLRVAHPEKASKAELVIVKMAEAGSISRELPLADGRLRQILRDMEPRRETTIVRR